ncbi:MAG: DNA-directed RNA polymerase subunit beta [Deltaproteobacteria bacterium]|jgi:DNA-directed RNA polymerase subunit beta|nr:DNA-directed RNA polymerase subunit beta [Deltaproteobacteria bacterium]
MKSSKSYLRLRKSFGKTGQIAEMPNLIDIQRLSYERFLQKDTPPDKRGNFGLQGVFNSVFPIDDYQGNCRLVFLGYAFEDVKYDIDECIAKGMNYEAPLKIQVGLEIYTSSQKAEVSEELGVVKDPRAHQTVHLRKDPQWIYFGTLPFMTEKGTFIINGSERVIVSQLHRSPGIFFDHDRGKSHSSGKILYSARIIPARGSWLDLEFDAKDLLIARIDRHRKFPVTLLLKALGYNTQEIIDYFYQHDILKFTPEGTFRKLPSPDHFLGSEVTADMPNPLYIPPEKADKLEKDKAEKLGKAEKPVKAEKSGKREKSEKSDKSLAEKKTRDPKTRDEYLWKKSNHLPQLMPIDIKKLRDRNITELPVDAEKVFLNENVPKYAAKDIYDPLTGEVLLEVNQPLTPEVYAKIIAVWDRIPEVPFLFINTANVSKPLRVSSSLRDTLAQEAKDYQNRQNSVETQEEAIAEIFRKNRPSSPVNPEAVKIYFTNLFFHPEHYDLSIVGRMKLNQRLFKNQKPPSYVDQNNQELNVLTRDDILAAVKELLRIKDTEDPVDDIDHLGNRRVRAVGELLENQYRIGLVRMDKSIRERMTMNSDILNMDARDLINSKPVTAVVKEFFGTSQLSQFMDQNNPLSEITHKRRLSALGPGGLTRERAGYEVRDVHPTHYGRICPIETPEGPNIGLIVSLATYARVNEHGFIETPYRLVENGKPTDKVCYLSAVEEANLAVAQANVPLDNQGEFLETDISCHQDGNYVIKNRDQISYMDVSPNQLVSVAAALIPFLEHDDANRALMGSNMQRQAVPLLRTEAPLVGTGIEKVVAKDSGVTILAAFDGVVEDADASRIIMRYTDPEAGRQGRWVQVHKLDKFKRSNHSTCFNQRPIVSTGDVVRQGQVLADGPATEMGELALGRNVMVAFMTWGGYNFEDSILVSERLVKEDIFTSIHIEVHEVIARDTKLGPEEITRDIPNIGDESLAQLDASGIVRVGAYVKHDDILVGRVTPKGETQPSPEEKLLRAIFGDKANDSKDTSYRLPPGAEGIVVDARVFYRKGTEKCPRSIEIENDEIARLDKDLHDEISIIKKNTQAKLAELLTGKTLMEALPIDMTAGLYLEQGELLTDDILNIPPNLWKDADFEEDKAGAIKIEILNLLSRQSEQIEILNEIFVRRKEKILKGDELPPGIIKKVTVFVATKRKLSVGDKMCGRHGNKGVVSRVLPEEDMPFFADGTPVDLVVNPLGVPSRMNVGQILETHLGWASRALGAEIGHLVDEANHAGLRFKLKKIFGEKEYAHLCGDLSEEELLEVAARSKNGFHLATPVFDGASEEEIRQYLNEAGLPITGQTTLRDGRTGEAFENEVTVGVMYMLKLHHLVDDKIHARSIGPYSLVTQQPLGGKAQFGGQRLGEMEVWAMEAYGAAYSLQEFLTVKSDDVTGRTRMYEKIVKGDTTLEAGLPESFNVLVKELQSLGLDVDLIEDTPLNLEEA